MRRLAKTVVAVLVLTGTASFLVPQPASAETGARICQPAPVLGVGVQVTVDELNADTGCI
jgi:hypothetical protein